MTRQIALGAIIAFAVTVLALSVWEPKPEAAPPPAPAAAPIQPAPLGPANVMVKPAMLRPASLRADLPTRKFAERGQLLAAPMEADAGTP